MSRVAPPGDRERMEELLTDGELEVIRLLCEAGGQPARNWHLILPVRAGFELIAWTRLARAYQDDGAGVEKGELWAAIHLGLGLETLRSRYKRWGPIKVHDAPGTAA